MSVLVDLIHVLVTQHEHEYEDRMHDLYILVTSKEAESYIMLMHYPFVFSQMGLI